MALKLTNLQERYELKEVLGRDGTGAVYKAHDGLMNREVALRIVEVDNPATIERFYNEWTIISTMAHPNVVNILDIGEFDENGSKKPFFVMPLLPGITLDKLLKETNPRLGVADAFAIVDQACRGLHAAHEQGLVHGGVKPSSIFVTDDGAVKIIDFGIARDVSAKSGATIEDALYYLSPEQLALQPPTALSDLFAIAVVAYEALARQRPFRGANEHEIAEAIRRSVPPPVSEVNQYVSFPVSQVVHKAMAKEPSNRFFNTREFADALQKASRSEPLDFDSAKIKPRLQRAAKSFEEGDYAFAAELISELEAEGYLDHEIGSLRARVDEAIRQTQVKRVIESARRFFEAGEYPLALRKIQEALELNPEDDDALALKTRVEGGLRDRKVAEWIALARQHMENSAFRQARQALDNVADIKPSDTEALGLLAEIGRREQELSRGREDKSRPQQPAIDPRREQQAYESTKARWVEQSHKYLADGDYDRAMQTVQNALAEFPAEPELLELEKLVRKHQERASQAMDGLRRARELGDRGAADEALGALREAAQLDPRNTVIRTVLINSLLDRARRLADSEPGTADAAVKEVLALEPSHAGAQSLAARIADKKREGFVSWCLSQAGRMQTEGDFDGALAVANQGLAAYPTEPRLRQLQATLQQGQAGAAGRPAQTPAIQTSDSPSATAAFSAMAPPLEPAFPPGPVMQATAPPAGPPAQTPFQAAAPPPPPPPPTRPAAKPSAPKPPKPPKPPRPPARPMAANQKKLLVLGGAAAAVIAIAGGGAWFLLHGRKPAPAPTPVAAGAPKLNFGVAATPLGADIAVDGVSCGKSTCLSQIGPGNHTVVAKLAGYQDATATFNVEPTQKNVPPLSLTLQPAGSRLSISTDLPSGSIKIDGNPAGQIDNGAGEISGLSPGKHKVQIDAGASSASFDVELSDGQVPKLSALQANSLRSFVIARNGEDARLYGSLPGFKATLDGKALGPVTVAGSDIKGLAAGAHELAIAGPAQQHDEISFETQPASAVYVSLRTDHLEGTLRINVDQDQADVYINGAKYRRPVVKGRLVIYLPVKSYVVRVQKDGFAPAEQTAVLKRGEETKLQFNLAPARATLQIHHAPPGAEVLIDGRVVGSASADGELTVDSEIGRHSIIIRQAQFKNLQADRVLTAGKPTDLDATLEPLTGTIHIEVSPTDARLRLKPENGPEREITGAAVNNLPEGSYTITASAPRYQDASTTVRVSASKTVSATLSLRPVETKAPPKTVPTPTPVVTMDEIRKTPGWTAEGDALVKRGGDVSLVATDLTQANIRFTVQSLKGKRLEWVVGFRDVKNYYLFQMDDKNFYRIAVVEGKHQDQVKVPHKLDRKKPIGINVAITPSSIVHSLLHGSEWVVIDKWEFPVGLVHGRFGFEVPGKDEIAVSEFQLSR